MNTLHAPNPLRPVDRDRDLPRRSAPSLRVVARQQRSHKGRVFAVAMVMVFLALLGNAVLSSILVTNQEHLDRVTADVADERARQQRLEVEAAQLRSPERIVDEAEKMGMVRPGPGEVEFLDGDDDDAGTTGSSRNAGSADEEYAEDATSTARGSEDRAGR